MGGRVRAEAAQGLPALALGADGPPTACLVGEHHCVHEALEEVALVRSGDPPRRLECLVRLEVGAAASEPETVLVVARDVESGAGMARILLVGVDLFLRGKFEALLPEHRFLTTEGIDPPDLVIADVGRIDPDDVAESFPEVPLLGFTNHTDTIGLQRAHAAGFDRVIVKSALFERPEEPIAALLTAVE